MDKSSSSGGKPRNGYVEYLKSIAKKKNETREKNREGEYDPADRFTYAASHEFPKDFLEALGQSNASSTGFLPPYGTPAPLFSNQVLTAAGYTYPSESPLEGQVVVANNDDAPRKVNTFGHENFHARARATKHLDSRSTIGWLDRVAPGAIGDNSYWELKKRMSKIADPGSDTSKWGLYPGERGAEELLANLVGYESALPKGKNILDSEVGKQLFYTNGKIDPRLRDYYFTHSSIPYGGIWEGQVPEESKLEAFTRKLKKKLRF